ncbi:hypothetical protein THTE_1756 [Thermogutta terrifontis]|uniref:Uncharacterized protein n=1 Tax=Thermogutta terrifontis TaxID=1331910 RepID=A0A286REI1_9BACT|nr:hypothetical protein [Thermogutta terrifontis]ASV74358.1 hypothetical protein THTE_1756 [Thermogutta terrifontis]
MSEALTKQLEASLAEQYRRVVCDIVRGKTVDREKVEALLVAAGRTPAELEADVAKEKRRLELIEKVLTEASLSKEAAKLHSELEQLREAYRNKKEEYERRILETNRRLRRVSYSLTESRQALQELLALFPELNQQ